MTALVSVWIFQRTIKLKLQLQFASVCVTVTGVCPTSLPPTLLKPNTQHMIWVQINNDDCTQIRVKWILMKYDIGGHEMDTSSSW